MQQACLNLFGRSVIATVLFRVLEWIISHQGERQQHSEPPLVCRRLLFHSKGSYYEQNKKQIFT